MFRRLFAKKTQEPVVVPKEDKIQPYFNYNPTSRDVAAFNSFFSKNFQRDVTQDIVQMVSSDGTQIAMDSIDGFVPRPMANQLPNALLDWYGSQAFIGYQAAAVLAQNWLVLKCCNLPAKDAIRKGYEITVNDGTDVDTAVFDAMRKADVKHRVNHNLEQFITMGRMFGIRIALFKVDSPDPEYYLKPFNIDGVTPGSFKGIVQIDPYWCTPELDIDASSNAASMHYYEPTWWRIRDRRIHRTHLAIMRNGEVADILKPTYLYGGISVPQLIFERVYCAERTANEAPQLALTKRTIIQKVDLAQALANEDAFKGRLQHAAMYKDNFAIQVIGEQEEVQQFDTSLADLDAVIMSQYQLVAAVANVPATKLLGTTPKGFNSTGEHEESSYHEELESLQASHLTPFLERYYAILMRSEIAPLFSIEPFEITVAWNTLDSVNATELAAINKAKADTGQVLIQSGAIDAQDERQRVVNDPQSGYNGLDHTEELSLPDEEFEA